MYSDLHVSMLACFVCQIFQVWWHTPLVLALERQRQVNLYEFEISLVCVVYMYYIVSSRPTWGYAVRSCLKKQT